MRLPSGSIVLALSLPVLATVACIAQGEGVLHLRDHGDAGPPAVTFLDASSPGSFDAGLPQVAPHSVVAVDPAHGAFTGGGRAVVRGTGFTSTVRVWFGANEVPSTDVVPLDPAHVQVVVPAGAPGLVDVATQNGGDGSTRTTLPQGYLYDSFYVTPSTGPVAGGTLVRLFGDGTHWDAATTVLIDGVSCTGVTVGVAAGADGGALGATDTLSCRTPPGTEGSKTVRVVTASGGTDLQDGFVYGDSDNGFSGGLSGNPLGATLKVIALNSFTSTAIASAKVVLGTDVSAAGVYTADQNGVVVATRPNLGPTVTVTVAGHCFSPTTFVDVPVDTVTVYLDPILSPTCVANGQPTGVGTGGGTLVPRATVKGQIVWPNGIEFQRGPWAIPFPSVADAASGIRRVAYIFELGRSLTQGFRLPSASSGVTPEADGDVGYDFSTSTSVGTPTLYALAGIEDRSASPPLFTAYAMGITPGVVTQSGATVNDVLIPMNIPLDHAIALDVEGPSPTPRGPDGVQATVGVRVSTNGFVILPIGTASALLPATAPLSFVGLPPLVNGLERARYEMTATASTGDSHSPPLSVLADFATTTAGTTVTLGGFVQVPVLDAPASNSDWNGQDLAVSAAPGGAAPDLTLFQIQSDGGLSTWTVVAPGAKASFSLPDLSSLGDVGLTPGPVTLSVTRAQINGFDYGALTDNDLTTAGYTEYATDVFQAHY
ncbi:MAG TPA: IPT/TIG domain-containing protein [Polyangiaceae bacterium]|nr:IPT/TIG domain-containing protein [Polyangiaceae bacterium]